MSLYSEKDLARVRNIFDHACADLFKARDSGTSAPVSREALSRCIDALLDALIDLEVVEESMRIEGNLPMGEDDLAHIRPTPSAGGSD